MKEPGRRKCATIKTKVFSLYVLKRVLFAFVALSSVLSAPRISACLCVAVMQIRILNYGWVLLSSRTADMLAHQDKWHWGLAGLGASNSKWKMENKYIKGRSLSGSARPDDQLLCWHLSVGEKHD